MKIKIEVKSKIKSIIKLKIKFIYNIYKTLGPNLVTN